MRYNKNINKEKKWNTERKEIMKKENRDEENEAKENREREEKKDQQKEDEQDGRKIREKIKEQRLKCMER